MAGRGAHGRHLKLDDICHPCLIETTFIWNYFKSTCRAHHLSSDSCQKRRLGFSWGANLTPILSLDPFTQQTHKKRLGTLSSAKASFYRRESWRGGKRKRGRGGDDGKGKEKKQEIRRHLECIIWQRLPPFPSSHCPPRSFCCFYWDTQREPSAEERGLDTSLISIDVFIAIHFSLAFVCLIFQSVLSASK